MARENIPDDPIIERLMRCGEDDGLRPFCPICSRECNSLYLDTDGDVIGCEHCISQTDSFTYVNEDAEEINSFTCPCCGATCEPSETMWIYFDMFGDQLRACEDCIETVDAYDWTEENR